mmetsp:Transcript_102086/g.184140  ORF Transcript_102086/g.184140 Transcript_102086/m.184140 type:complete len:237 (+) Transcript_102086:1003-1713(+)
MHPGVAVQAGLQVAGVLDTLLELLDDGGVVAVRVALDVGAVGVHLLVQRLELLVHRADGLVDFAPARVHLQAERRRHVPDCLHRGVDVVVHVAPGGDVGLGVQLGLRLLAVLHDVLAQLPAALVALLQTLRDVLHPGVVRLQGLLHVAHVQAHGGDLGGHSGLDALPGGNDGVGGVHACPHLIEIHVDCVHRSREVLHVSLAGQHDALHVGGVVLGSAQHVLEFAHLVLHGIQVVG